MFGFMKTLQWEQFSSDPSSAEVDDAKDDAKVV